MKFNYITLKFVENKVKNICPGFYKTDSQSSIDTKNKKNLPETEQDINFDPFSMVNLQGKNVKFTEDMKVQGQQMTMLHVNCDAVIFLFCVNIQKNDTFLIIIYFFRILGK